jgi:tRNA pseudouridine13 synthase
MATERIRLYGNNLVVGDLVAVASNGETSTESKEIEDGQEALASSRITEVKVLETEEDLKGYTMDDLVLPLPGISVSYPKNDVFKAYETFMGLNGFHPLEMERKQKEFSLPGSYRKVLGRASDLEWRLVRYEDSTISLCQTDLDKSLGKPVVNSVAGEKSFNIEGTV